MAGSRKRKRDAPEVALHEAVVTAIQASQNTLVVSGLPLFATEADIAKLFGMLLDTYMRHTIGGVSTKDCYVRFKEESTALEALKKDKQLVSGHSVRVEVSSVTLDALRAKKSYQTIRQVPYDWTMSDADIEAIIRQSYQTMLKGQFVANVDVQLCYQNCPHRFKHKYALVTFTDTSHAAIAMSFYEKRLSKKPPPPVIDIAQIYTDMNSCKVLKFWSG